MVPQNEHQVHLDEADEPNPSGVLLLARDCLASKEPWP